MLLALAVLFPSALLFIALGLLMGTVLSDKAVGGVSSILVNVAAWLSGTWFSLELVGGAFAAIGHALPFAPAVNAARAAMTGSLSAIFPNLWIVIGYAAALFALAVFLFSRKMHSGKAVL